MNAPRTMRTTLFILLEIHTENVQSVAGIIIVEIEYRSKDSDNIKLNSNTTEIIS